MMNQSVEDITLAGIYIMQISQKKSSLSHLSGLMFPVSLEFVHSMKKAE